LETTWQALESAGQNPQKLRNSQTGVFIGCMTQDYAQLSYSPQAINAYTGSGTSVQYGGGSSFLCTWFTGSINDD
jgi:microcystin synthetase protein McyD